ncbi:uncharacterized protein LOC103131376 [Poecilia formosa]|uniref:uncharacterized protein LOC103131376 n=1 Tax=Poecilia formosa TaxID=48698 RepID=UPI000443E48C|nr:PREDICTED: uncharacterized protein LOC103131376 [Poecilia formosa]
MKGIPLMSGLSFWCETSNSFFVSLTSLLSDVSSLAGLDVKIGTTVTLPCVAPGKPITVVEWSRKDLGEEYVLLYRDEKIDPSFQHLSFENRVDLQDREMKGGNVSLVLKNVTMNDKGTYECKVVQRGRYRGKILINNITLVITSSSGHFEKQIGERGEKDKGNKEAGHNDGEKEDGFEAPIDKINVTAEPGQNVTLPCRSAEDKHVIIVQWSRRDLGSEYVLLYRDYMLDPENQHPSYKNRVDLKDRQMKDGDVSLVLENVTTNDRGIYECRVIKTNRHMKISTIDLVVAPLPPGNINRRIQDSGNNRANYHQHIGLIPAAILTIVVCISISLKKGRSKER